MLWVLGLSAVLSAPVSASQADWPQTRAEKTNYAETSHYADVMDFLYALQAKGSPIRIQLMGKSTKGRDMPLVIAARPPVASAAEARRTGKPIVYIQANIHAGEVEGKESALKLLRKWAQEPGTLLDSMVLLVTPIYNIDGNEEFGPVSRNRPGQNGPDPVGLRPNGQGLDLNRDCMKAESPEMRALLEHVYNKWDPDVIMDLHTTNGTRHGYDLTYSPPLNPNTESGIMAFARDKLLPTVRKRLQDQGLPTFDYGNASNRDGGHQWFTFGQEGRYVTNYAGLRNRIGILSEAASFIPFKDRIEATDKFVWETLRYVSENGSEVVRLTREADATVTSWGLDPSKSPELGVRFDFDQRGTEKVRMERPGTTGNRGRPTDIVDIEMPVFDRFKPTKARRLPAAYWLLSTETKVVELLLRHGIIVEMLPEKYESPTSYFTITSLNEAAREFQGHRLIQLEGNYQEGRGEMGPGSFIVRTAQPLAILVFHLLEPESLDGVAAWGFLDPSYKPALSYPIVTLFEVPKTKMIRITEVPEDDFQRGQ